MLLDLFETPLLNSEGVVEVDPSLTKVGEFLAWEEAQSMSIAAAMQISSYVNLVNPLQNLTNATLLGKIWDHVNTVCCLNFFAMIRYRPDLWNYAKSYMNEAGQDIDSLWQLVNVRHRIPYFSTLYVPSSSSNEPRPLKQKKGSIRQRSGIPFRISYMDNDEEIPDPTMPDLIVASDSEDERRRRDSSEDDDRDGSDIQSYTSYASDRDYESDQSVEDNLETLHLKALEMYNQSSQVVVSDEHASERKNNPFLDLLGSLKGMLYAVYFRLLYPDCVLQDVLSLQILYFGLMVRRLVSVDLVLERRLEHGQNQLVGFSSAYMPADSLPCLIYIPILHSILYH